MAFRNSVAIVLAMSAVSVDAQPAAPEILFRNVRVFDGSGSGLSAPTSVLVRGNVIAGIGAGAKAGGGVAIIEGKG